MPSNMLLVYLDLTGYSKNNELMQLDFFRSFQKEIDQILYEELTNVASRATAIPTGDGMIIGLSESPTAHVKAMELVFRVFQWTKREGYGIRCSIHAGPVHPVVDINRQNNIVGNSVNDAARMLAGTDDNTIVISQDFYRRFFASTNDPNTDNLPVAGSDLTMKRLDEDTVLDKHSNVHHVVSVELSKGGESYGGDGKILTRHYTRLYAHDFPKKQSRNQFIERISGASHVVLYGIYHPNTPDILSAIDLTVDTKIDIDIYFASADINDELQDFFVPNGPAMELSTRDDSLNRIRSWARAHKSQVQIGLYEYRKLPTFGLSAIDYRSQDHGFIHVSHYIRGVEPEETPYIELTWKTKKPHPLYQFYSKVISGTVERERTQI